MHSIKKFDNKKVLTTYFFLLSWNDKKDKHKVTHVSGDNNWDDMWTWPEIKILVYQEKYKRKSLLIQICLRENESHKKLLEINFFGLFLMKLFLNRKWINQKIKFSLSANRVAFALMLSFAFYS